MTMSKRLMSERESALADLVAEVYERPAALWAMGLDWMARAQVVLAESHRCTCPAGSYDYPNAVHEPYCAAARLDGSSE